METFQIIEIRVGSNYEYGKYCFLLVCGAPPRATPSPAPRRSPCRPIYNISQVITRKQFSCEILSETLVLFVVRLHSVRGLFRGLHSIELAVLVA